MAGQEKELSRYAVKFLFQFRVEIAGDSGEGRLCERRIVLFKAINAEQALSQAKHYAQEAEFDYINDEGNPVYFEFLGVMEMKYLDHVCEENEVWYEICEHVSPEKRINTLIPPAIELSAFRNQSWT